MCVKQTAQCLAQGKVLNKWYYIIHCIINILSEKQTLIIKSIDTEARHTLEQIPRHLLTMGP